MRSYCYITVNGFIFDTLKECLSYIRWAIREDGFVSKEFKQSPWQYKKSYYDDREPIYFSSNGYISRKL